MRKEEKAALDVLAKASDVHNCWACLDEAVTCGERDGFTRDYIEGEREMLEGSIKGAIRALVALGGLYGIAANNQNGNSSYAYMHKVRDEHLTELESAKEFDRGYRAGKQAMDAERRKASELERERAEVVANLREFNSDEIEPWFEMQFWCLLTHLGIDKSAGESSSCNDITHVRDRLIHLLGGDEPNLWKMAKTINLGGEHDSEVMENGENHKIATITDELREYVESEYSETIEWYQHPQTLIAIADRIEERFDRICEQQEAVLQQTIDMMVDERDELKAKLDAIREVLDGRD